MLGVGRIGLKLDGMTKFGGGLVEIALLESFSAFRNIEVGILRTIVRGREFPAFFEFCGSLIFASCSREREPELVVGLATLRIEPGGFLEFLDGFGHFAVPQNRLAQGQVRARKVWGQARSLYATARSLWPVRISTDHTRLRD